MKTFPYILVILFPILSPPALSQGKKADYDRANSVQKWTSEKIVRGQVTPNWINNSSKFWYRKDLLDGKRAFIYVDPETPVKRPAFDHARAAASLSKTLGRPVTADKLPIEAIAYPENDTKTLRLQVGAKTFACALDTYTLTESKDAIATMRSLPLNRRLMSRRTGAETNLTFINRTQQEVTLYWANTEGQRQAYGKLAPGQSRDQHTFAGHVWVAANAEGRPVAAFEAGDKPEVAIIDDSAPKSEPAPQRPEPGLSPDGKWRVTIRENNLFLLNNASKTETQLTQDGSAQDKYEGPVFWSPDSTRMVVQKTIPEQEHKIYMVESSPKDQLQPKLHTFDYLKPGDRIAHSRPTLFDITTHRSIPIKDDLFPNPWEISEIDWEANSKRFTFLYNQRGHQVMRLISVDANTGETKPLIDEQARTFIDWTNKVTLHRIKATNEAIWMSERDGWNHLYLYDTAAGTVKNQITKGEWVVREIERVDDAKRQIWFRAGGILPGQDPYYLHHCRVDFDGKNLTVLTAGDGTHTVVFSPEGKYLVDTYSRVDMPFVSEVRRVDNGKKTLDLEHGDASALLATGWRIPERFVTKARDGKTDIYGVIVRPSNFDPKRKYPIIENIYAGPQGAFVPKGFLATNGLQAMAELGLIMVQMDGMGTNYRSKAFHDVCFKNLGDAGFPDRILWIKAAAKKYPYMDLTRVGIYGTSAGGQNALGGLLQHGDFYKAGVADCGCHDNRMDKIWWNEQWMGWPIGEHYAAQSNVTLAPKLQGKLLLMVGELDSNVDPASTMQVVNALIKADKDFDLLVLPGGGHGVVGSPYGRRRLQDFFVRNLLGVEPRTVPVKTARKTP